MVRLDDIYKKNEENFVSRLIVDEVVIMPLCRSEDDILYIYSISNETGSRIWQLLDGKHSARDIQEIIKTEFQGRGELIDRGVLEFLEDLLSVRLIEKSRKEKVPKTSNRRPQTEYRAFTKKKPYKTPEIAKIKMQPEQAVLSCCTSTNQKGFTTYQNACAVNSHCSNGNFCNWDGYQSGGSTDSNAT